MEAEGVLGQQTTQHRVRNIFKVTEASKLLQWTHFVSSVRIWVHAEATCQCQVSSSIALQLFTYILTFTYSLCVLCVCELPRFVFFHHVDPKNQTWAVRLGRSKLSTLLLSFKFLIYTVILPACMHEDHAYT